MRQAILRFVVSAPLFVALHSELTAQPKGDANPGFENRVARLETSLAESNRAKDVSELKTQIAEARQGIQDAAYSRLEILLGVFGLLITLLVVVFGFRTEKAAARAAQGEIADRKRELDEIMAKARAAADAAEKAREAAESASALAISHAKSAADQAALAKQGAEAAQAAVVAPAQVETLADASLELETAKAKSEDERTSGDYRTLIRAQIDKKNWKEAIKLAREMQMSGINSKSDYFYALAQEAYALGHLERYEEGSFNYDKIIAADDNSSDESIKKAMATSYFNRALFRQLKEDDYTITTDLDEVIKRFDSEESESIKKLVGAAYLQKAVALAGKRKIQQAINLLKKWEQKVGSFDCEQVVDNPFFKDISEDPQLSDFLAEKGCAFAVDS